MTALDAVLALLAIGLALLCARLTRVVAALRQRAERLREELAKLELAFHRFTPAPVVDEVVARGAVRSGERRQVTVLFADLQGFTALSDRLPPETLVRILNGYFQAMSTAIAAQHGHVSKFIGDGLMAIFGAVEQNPWQARDAVLAALAMREALTTYNRTLQAEGQQPLQFGVGIHGGEVVAGVLGSERLMEFTVIGDVVNVAARVESLTRQHGVDVLITDEVQAQLGTHFDVQAMPPLAVKGKPQPIRTWAVLCRKTVAIPA